MHVARNLKVTKWNDFLPCTTFPFLSLLLTTCRFPWHLNLHKFLRLKMNINLSICAPLSSNSLMHFVTMIGMLQWVISRCLWKSKPNVLILRCNFCIVNTSHTKTLTSMHVNTYAPGLKISGNCPHFVQTWSDISGYVLTCPDKWRHGHKRNLLAKIIHYLEHQCRKVMMQQPIIHSNT